MLLTYMQVSDNDARVINFKSEFVRDDFESNKESHIMVSERFNKIHEKVTIFYYETYL